MQTSVHLGLGFILHSLAQRVRQEKPLIQGRTSLKMILNIFVLEDRTQDTLYFLISPKFLQVYVQSRPIKEKRKKKKIVYIVDKTI